MTKYLSALGFAALLAVAPFAPAATITVNSEDNTDFSAGVTNLVTALLAVSDGDTIAFNIPGPGPHYLQSPVGGFPLLIKDNVTINGYTQPGSGPNSLPITSANSATIGIVLDSRNGNYRSMNYPMFTTNNSSPPIDNTAMATERGGFGSNEVAILGIYRATNANIQGLAFLGDTYTGADPITHMIAVAHDYGLVTNVLGSLAYNQGSSRNCHINGCWFGVDPANPTPGGLTQTFSAIAFYRHRGRPTGDIRPELPNESLIVGVKPGSSTPSAQFNVIAYMGEGLSGEAIRTHFSGNFLGVMPDGVTPTGIPATFAGAIEIGRYADTLPVVLGTDGDGVNDDEEGNLFGPFTDPIPLFDFFSASGKLHIIAGNRFGIDVNGGRWTNSQSLFATLPAGATVRIGSDFDSVSDAYEANLIYNNYPFDDLFPTPTNSLPPSLLMSPNVNSRVSMRGNLLVNNGLSPFDYADRLGGRLVNFTNYSRGFLSTNSPNGIIPTLSASTQFRLNGKCAPLNSSGIYTNHLMIDVYVADSEGLANGAKFELPELDLTNGFPQGQGYLGYLRDNGPYDLNPASGQFEFDITSFGWATGTVVTVTANYSADPFGTHNGRVGTSDFSYPVTLEPAPTYNLNILAGYNLIANQLDRGSNTLSEIMPVVPEGCYLFKYDNAVGFYLAASFEGGAWQPGDLTLNPGEGAWLHSPTNFPLELTGSPHVPVLPLSNNCAGFRLLSRQTNDFGSFENITGAAPVGGERIYKWIGTGYNVYEFLNPLDGWDPSEPTLAVGEAAWIRLITGPSCPGGPNTLTPPPVITLQPVSQTVSPGANVTFTVVAVGDPPLTYQWRLNGNNPPGENNPSLTLNNVSPTNSGDYSVVVANPGGATGSRIAALIVSTPDAGFADNFAARPLTNSVAGAVSGSNVSATKEPGEPKHGGNSGGRSVWYAWLAPASGIATFSTLGSSFDTLLGVYTGTGVGTLKLRARDDDSAGFYASRVMFNAVAGTTYNLAIDGSYGVGGHIVLTWGLEITSSIIPEIVTQPQSQVGMPSNNITLSVTAGAGIHPIEYQWFQDSTALPDATNASFTISNLTGAKVGTYSVRVSTTPPDVRQVFSLPASVQMATVELGAFASAIAQDKQRDASPTGEGLLRPVTPLRAVAVAGFTGTQVFPVSKLMGKEPGERDHCSTAGGASMWLGYLAPASGRLSVDTLGSTFHTILAAYAGSDFIAATSQSCAACGRPAPLNAQLNFPVSSGAFYYIVVDGANGERGTVSFNYNLVTEPPVVANQPESQAVAANGSATLTVRMANTSGTPLSYQWQFEGNNIDLATQSSYTRTGFVPADHQGNYRVVVFNNAGTVTSSNAMLYLDTPPLRATDESLTPAGQFQAQWLAPGGSLTVQTSTDLTNWANIGTYPVIVDRIYFTDPSQANLTNRFYRAQLSFP